LSASWHIVKVPTESISITAEKKKRVTQLCSSKTSLSWAINVRDETSVTLLEQPIQSSLLLSLNSSNN
jgi:hypothetical protein